MTRKGGGRRERRPREMPLADEGQEYARVVAMLGNGRVRARFRDKTEHVCRIRGTMRRREWVAVGDTVLVALRTELAGDTADIVYRYQPQELQKLRAWGEPVAIAADDQEEEMDEVVTFEADEPEAEAAATQHGARATPSLPSTDSDSDFDFELV